MPQYHYQATNSLGEHVTGTIEAANHDDVVANLQEQGLAVVRIEEQSETQPADANDRVDTPTRLTEKDYLQVASRVADITHSGLPLSSGLRAMAEEMTSKRTQRVLLAVSQRLEAGDSLEQALNRYGKGIPQHLAAMIRAGAQSGNLGVMLAEYLTFARRNQDLRRRIIVSLTYPALLICATFLVTLLFLVMIVPSFGDIFEGFGMELPFVTFAVLTIADFVISYGWIAAVGFVAVVFSIWIGIGLLGGPALRRRLVNAIPLIGPIFHYAAQSRFCQILAMLVENGVPLPESVRLAGAGTGDPNLREGGRQVSGYIEHGEPLSEAATNLPNFSSAVVSLFRWEKQRNAFVEVLRASAELFAARTNIQTNSIAVIIEPIVLVTVAVICGGLVFSMFMPLIQLLNDLA